MFKLIVILSCILGLNLIVITQAWGAKSSTCKVETSDIGTIVGNGRNPSAAFEDAATQCFDRREKLYKKVKKSASVDEDTGLVMIDLCANIKCAS